MSGNLRILLIVFAVLLAIIIFSLISKKKIPVNISIFWLLSALIILILGLFPNFLNFFTKLTGFKTISNFVVGIMISILLCNTLLLTLFLNNQNKKIILLIQEVSLLKEKLELSGDKND